MQQRLIFFLALGGFGYAVMSTPGASDQAAPAAGASASPSGTSAGFFAADDAIAINRGSGGQFHLTGQIDGQDTEFLVDTGADIVALTVDEADRLGIEVDPAEFVPLMQTASGVGNGTIVQLDKLEIAGAEFTGVEAAVIEGLHTNLLGQSVLGRFAQVSLQGDRMVIRR